eukprot:TRINITY_DN85142_c0_g1_i1.p1 TRINITY_DN85142_c0_g1~~TRINITY_DN85142_c0_g1_i1.p1  ORF type:complete len:136 (+),score=29.88 TRINITY_DN85142_c0_g1_i1:32-409(+)
MDDVLGHGREVFCLGSPTGQQAVSPAAARDSQCERKRRQLLEAVRQLQRRNHEMQRILSDMRPRRQAPRESQARQRCKSLGRAAHDLGLMRDTILDMARLAPRSEGPESEGALSQTQAVTFEAAD